jgi:hypothetical protein
MVSQKKHRQLNLSTLTPRVEQDPLRGAPLAPLSDLKLIHGQGHPVAGTSGGRVLQA